MKPAIVSAIVAAIVSIGVVVLDEALERDDDDETGAADAATAAFERGPLSLSYTEELPEDVWVDGSRTAGSDRRSLADASKSVCYITKIEIAGVQGPQDTNSCVIAADDFTGFWELIATVEEGGQSAVRCNARCLVWE
jgi:hypothetical protein